MGSIINHDIRIPVKQPVFHGKYPRVFFRGSHETPWIWMEKFVVVPVESRLLDMGVSKNRGTPKWMVYNGKPY